VSEFLESHFAGDGDIVGEQGLRTLVRLRYQHPFGRLERPLTFARRRFLEWRQNNRDLDQARRNAEFHYGLPTEFFRLLTGGTYADSEGYFDTPAAAAG
jgi:cyclopropane-fatty-acyl-phospholipid synthase